MNLQQWQTSQANPEVVVNQNFNLLAALAVYGRDPTTTTGLTWGYIGGRWGGFAITAATLTLTASSTNYITVARSTGVISTATTDTNWNDTDNHARVYLVTTGTTTVSGFEDHRMGAGGVLAATGGGGGGGGVQSVVAGTGVSVDNTDPANPVVSATGGGGGLTVLSPVNVTGLTQALFTGIPDGVNRVTLSFNNVLPSSSTSRLDLQIGTGTTPASGTYFGSGARVLSSGTDVTGSVSTCLPFNNNGSISIGYSGHVLLTRINNNLWAMSGILASISGQALFSAASINLSGPLNVVCFFPVSGGTFVEGFIGISYET